MISSVEYLKEQNLEFNSILISGDMPIQIALQQINNSGLGVLLMVDEHRILQGVITDGDLRRAIINHVELSDSCKVAVTPYPVTVQQGDELSAEYLFDNNTKNIHINHIPVVNAQGVVIDLLLHMSYMSIKKSNTVVIMAGGLGSRLGSLTEHCPKPMLKIYDKPLLEILIDKFKSEGFFNFHFSLNYKSEMVQSYFGNGRQYGVNIHYLLENKRLGTAGSLSLLDHHDDLPIIVMNGDIITKVNFRALLNFHKQMHADVTVCTIKRAINIPYGVIENSQHILKNITEKPTKEFYINAGIYVLNASVLNEIPKDEFYDMTDLLKKLIPHNKVSVFPIHEYWIDVGHIDDLERAKSDRMNYEFSC